MIDGLDGRIAWVSGAGSGIGRAAALQLAAQGCKVGLMGRRPEPLRELEQEIQQSGGSALAVPVDVRDAQAVSLAVEQLQRLGEVTDVVLAAGLNNPRRYWRDQDPEIVASIVSTNILGCSNLIQHALPTMRAARRGTVTIISSYSGWRFSPDAGVAYSASKRALLAFSESLNHQEGPHGIRACTICPGDVDSDFLDLRPNVPGREERTHMLSPADVGRAVVYVVTQPDHVCVDELVISPRRQG